MSDHPLSETVKAKTDQLNADDMIGVPPITVTLVDMVVDQSKNEQPWIMKIDGGWKPYKPGLSMRRVLLEAWKDDGQQGKTWIGRRMTLFRDPDIVFAGLKVGGVRISHLSDLEAPELAVAITVRKGVKNVWTIKRLEDAPANPTEQPPPLTDAEKTYIEDCTAELANAETMDQLSDIGDGLSKKSESVKAIMRPVYAACAAKLKKTENKEPTL